ncbi:MAG: cytidine deaminase [Flavobacteriia bacterium]|nr:cytidine deaminase [Flavobacteriia bacterium]
MKKLTWSADFEIGSIKDLNEADRELIHIAKQNREHAYAPYSRFKVSAVAKMESGETVAGLNQENAAYPSGLCAERVALFAAGAHYPTSKVETLVILTQSIGDVPATSCGACRQVMMESENRQSQPIRVLFVDEEGKVLITKSVADLIPFAFHADRLG